MAPNLPGFGTEPASKKEPDLNTMAQHVARVLDDAQANAVVLAGFSMGGYVALSFVDQYPARVTALGLISSQPFADTDQVRAGRRTMIDRVRREGAEAAAKAALPKLFAPGKHNDPELAAHPTRGAAQAGVDGIAWALEAMARRPDRMALLKNLSIPLLIVHGADDQFIPVDKIRPLAGRLPHADYVEIPGAGHCTPLESSAGVADALKRLLGKARA